MIAELVAKNMKAEAEAIEEYLPLLNALKEAGDEKGVALVEEIISEEIKHSVILTAMLIKNGGGLYIEPDGTKDAINFIKRETEK